MEDDRISLLETQLAQARLIAEESDKKYEEVRSGLRVEVVGFWIIQWVAIQIQTNTFSIETSVV